ncbi:MAG: hypothetical protein JXA01_02060 [Dehalococcoidia bacterium]|nr:hypothetical protein [Dehalococcoidia bacterium]
MIAGKRLCTILLGIIMLTAAFPIITAPAPVSAEDAWTDMSYGTINDLHGVWGSSAHDVFAVGDEGTILHYNGSTWSAMTSSTANDLHGVWGSYASNVFAAGSGGTILHYNGSTWSSMTSGTANNLHGVWGSSGNDVFTVGDSGTIMHYNGSTWSAVTSGTANNLNAVWGSSCSNVFTVGDDGTILHYNGSSWSAMTSNTTADLYGIWGSSTHNIWAVGAADSTLHYDGSIWTNTLFPTQLIHRGIWGASYNQVFKVGVNGFSSTGYARYYNGSTWSAMTIPAVTVLYGVYGFCSHDVFAVGTDGAILHYGNGSCPVSASISTGLGPISFSVGDGLIEGLTHISLAQAECSLPADYALPYGFFSFRISGIDAGQAVRITIRFPRPLPANVKYYKCVNGTLADVSDLVTRLNAHTLVLTITDGGKGDLDGLVNSVIVDPGGPAIFVGTADATTHGQGTTTAVSQQSPVLLPSISVRSASLSAAKVAPGTPVTITANVVNTGAANGSNSIKIYVNGEIENSQGVTVSGGGSTPLTFTVSRNDPGTYSVYVGGVSAGSFTVDRFADPDIILFISGAAILFAFIVGVVYMSRRKQVQ